MDEIRQIPLTALHESPFNPRKTYPEHELLELAESIKSQGIMQPIVARIQPEEVNKHGHFEYELIFGHRRLRAAWLAALESAPVIVRTMTDKQAAIARMHENMKRQDVTALEEADGYVHLRDAHRMTAEQIGAAVGKTKSYVYARLKLAAAAPEVRDAVTTRGMSPEIALLIGRLPHFDMQRLALKSVLLPQPYGAPADEPERWASVRDTKLKLKRLFENDVDVAQFDIADDGLIESAGACTSCPKRAGNMESLAEILDSGICTDSTCYTEKQAAFVWLKTDQMREAGHRVVEGEEASELMPYSGWMHDHRSIDERLNGHSVGEGGTLRDVLAQEGAPQLKTTVVVDPHNGRVIEALTSEEISELHAFVRARFGETPREASPAEIKRQQERDARDARIAALPPAQRACMDMDVLRDVRRAVLMAMVDAPRSVDELRCMVMRELDMGDSDLGVAGETVGLRALLEAQEETAGDDFDPQAFAKQWVREQATPQQLSLIVAMMGVEDALSWTYRLNDNVEQTQHMVALAKSYGIDPADFLLPEEEDPEVEEIEPSTPSTAARAQEGGEGHAAGVDGESPAGAAAAPAKKPKPIKKAAKVKIAKVEAGSAGDDQKDEPADAGAARDPNTSDMFDKHPEVAS